MLNYKSLTVQQRKWVDTVMLIRPAIQDQITRQEILDLHNQFQRDKLKFSIPNWLMCYNQIGRGVYAFPRPENKLKVEKTDPLVNQVKDLIDD